MRRATATETLLEDLLHTIRAAKQDERIQVLVLDLSKLNSAGISKVVIERAANKAKVFIHAAKPGIILGKRATGLDALSHCIEAYVSTN